MDISTLKKHGRKFVLVYKDDKKVLDDYIQSLDLFDICIELAQFSIPAFLQNDFIYVFTQMWLPADKQPSELIQNPRFVFLNVENLTEQNRFQHITAFIEAGAKIADYSPSNVKLMENYIKDHCPQYPYDIFHIPYQFHLKDFCQIYNPDHEYEYDVGIINAYVEPHESVNSMFEYRRNKMWELVQKETDWKSINIMGWDKERDDLIKKCKVIINIHHFNCFFIFQHIRCDRMIFANKLIVSDISLYGDTLDVYDYVTWRPFDNIIQTTKEILTHFNAMQRRMELLPKKTVCDARHSTLQKVVDDLCQQNDNE